MDTENAILLKTVIKEGYCIGCGACTAVKGSPFKVKMDEFGNYTATVDDNEGLKRKNPILHVCPFSGVAKNETEIGDMLFPNNSRNKYIGNFLKCYAGYVSVDGFRSKGSSGGMGKWIGYTLLKDDEVDYFIQLVPNSLNEAGLPLFDFKVFSNPDDVLQHGSKSCYYPTTLEHVIKIIIENPGRYAITGVPCFIKSIRLLSLDNQVIAERIKYTIGIVCGGMKSGNQSKMIGWQLGVHPDDLRAIDFRRKHIDKPSNHKIYQVWSTKDNEERFRDDREIIGTDYGAGFFKPNACDYCDDVVGETADISIGDAWLPKYVSDPKGTCVVVVRNKHILSILEKYSSVGDLLLDEITDSDVFKSQESGFRHRREGLSYRISKKIKKGEWYPNKRVQPNEFKLSRHRKKIYSFREEIAKISHFVFLDALEKNDFSIFQSKMKIMMDKYRKLNKGTLSFRLVKRIKKVIGKN